MVYKEDGKAEEKKIKLEQRNESLLPLWHCLSPEWGHLVEGSTVDKTGLDLIRKLQTRFSSLPLPPVLFQTPAPHQLLPVFFSSFPIWTIVIWNIQWKEDLAKSCVDYKEKRVFLWAALKSLCFSSTSGIPMASVGESVLQREEIFCRSSWPQEVNLYHIFFKLLSTCCRAFVGIK